MFITNWHNQILLRNSGYIKTGHKIISPFYSALAFRWVSYQDPQQKAKNREILKAFAPKSLSYFFVFFFSVHKRFGESYFCFSCKFLNTCGMMRFWCSYPLNGPSDTFLFLGRCGDLPKRDVQPRAKQEMTVVLIRSPEGSLHVFYVNECWI